MATQVHAAPRATRRRWPWIVGGAALLVVVLLWALAPEPPPRLLTATVTRGAIARTVVATGTVEASQLVSVGTRASGEVRRLAVTLGQRVRAGDLIGEIDPTTQRNQLRNAEAALANVQAQRAAREASRVQAQLAYRRQATLLAEDATARADYEAARATLDAEVAQLRALDAQIAQARTELDTARANLGYTRVVSPIDGTVVALVATQGQTVNAVQSSPTLVKIARLDPMTVEAEISEADVIRIRPGQRAWFTILGDATRRFPGTLRSIEPAPESLSQDDAQPGGDSGIESDEAVYYNALFDVPNPDGTLRIGMTAQVNVVLQTVRDAVRVPSAALGDRGPDGRHPVRVVDARGRPVERRVRIGIDDQVHAQVLDGLHAGERVVVGDAAAPEARSGFLPPRPPPGT